MSKNLNEIFQKYYNMKPYLQIEEDEWQHIIKTYEKDEVVDELSKCLHNYPCPIPDISEKETLKSLTGIDYGLQVAQRRILKSNVLSIVLTYL